MLTSAFIIHAVLSIIFAWSAWGMIDYTRALQKKSGEIRRKWEARSVIALRAMQAGAIFVTTMLIVGVIGNIFLTIKAY